MKSNAVTGGIFAAAILVSASLGLFAPNAANASDRILRDAVTRMEQTGADDRQTVSGGVYATMLSSGSPDLAGVQLSSSSLSSDVIQLPQEVRPAPNAPTAPISLDDPIVSEYFAEQEAIALAEAEAEAKRLAEEEAARKVAAGFVDPKSFGYQPDVYIDVSGGVWDDGFVFDINQTVYPVTEEEVEMLKYVVQAEAGDGTLESKRIVTYSIVNRMAAPSFPYSSLYDVLHARNQFSTIKNYYTKSKIPDQNTIRAVEEVLMGACEDNSQGCLYFYDASYPVAEKVRNWFENDLVYLYTIGNDRFFRDP